MTHLLSKYLTIAAMAVTGLMLCGCKKKLLPAVVEIVDPVRHYYPVIQGEVLGVSYEIENVSKEPLVIQEIQTTCGCLVPVDDLPLVVLPKKRGRVNLRYETIKNTGSVEHYVWLYGNFTDSTYRELFFDTNVVPPADYTRDYEQLYLEKITDTESASLKNFVDGYTTDRGYYTDENDPRAKKRKEIQRSADALAL